MATSVQTNVINFDIPCKTPFLDTPTCSPNDRNPNRSIILAVYMKRKNEPIIPSRSSSKRNAFFDQLLSDATTLVNALIDQM